MTRQRDCEFRQAIFCRRRHQPRRPPLAKIRPGRRCDLFTLVNNHLSNVFDLTHALYIWRELAPLTARVCLPDTWDNDQAVVATNALLRQYPGAGVPYAMMIAYASAYPCPQGQPYGGGDD
jgi:hypothetical protein